MINSTPTSADALIAALHEPGREHLLDLVRNPLRLTLLCMTWDGSSLPDTQAELYERYLRKIYKWNQNWHELEDHAERCGTTTTKLKQNLNQQLGELAKAALNLPQERFRLSQALVEKYLGEELDKTSLAYLALRLGWLNRVGTDGRGDAIFAFYHATFQEYFAALAVEDWDYFLPKNHCDRPVAGKEYRIFEKQWKQVILLWLGRGDIEANDKLEFVIKLTNFNDGCRKIYGLKSAFLVTEGISQLKDIDMLIPYKEYNYQEYKQYPLTVALIDNLIRAALWDFDVEPKKWIIYNQCFVKDAQEVLKRTTRSKVIAILEQKLSSISRCYLMNSVFKEKTQAEAEAQFKEIYTNREKAYLIANKMLCLEKMKVYLENIGCRSKIDDIFANFVDFLWEIDPENELITSSVSCLITTTENPRERLNTIKWLLTIVPDHPALVEGLVKTIMTASDSDSEWRDHEEAAQILGKVNPGNPLAVNWLLKLLDNNQDEIHCWPIAYHLGLVDPGNIQAQAVLLKIVETTQNEDIRWHLANCLEKYEPGNSGAIAVLLKIIETTDDEEVICDAFSSLQEIGKEHPDAIAGLLKIIENTDNQYICCDAIRNLRHIGIKSNNPDAMKILLKIIESTDNKDIFASAISHLKDFYQGDFDAIMKTFIKIIETTDNEDIFQSVLWCLDRIGKKHDTAVISVLFKKLEVTRNENVVGSICHKLYDISPEKRDVVISIFCQIINDGRLSFEVPYYLHRIDPENPHVIPALVRVIETTDNEDTRCQAMECLQEIDTGNPHVIPVLVRVIETTDNEDTRYQAAQYLHKIDPGNPHVIPALVRVIETTDNEDTAENAVRTFSNFECNHPEAISVLSKFIQSINNTKLLETAAFSLGIIDPGNTQAIITLIKINEINGSGFSPRRIRKFIGSWEGNNQAIAGLLEALETAVDSKTLTFVSKMLEEVGKGNYLAISGLMKILQTNTNQKICGYAAYSLAKIDPKNHLVIPELVKALEANQEEYTQWQLAWQLGKVDSSNERATDYLVGIIGTNDSQEILKEINWHLKEIEWGGHLGVSVIVKLLKISRDKSYKESPIYTHFHFEQTFDDICHGSTLATSRLIELIQSDYLEGDYSLYFEYLKRTIANQEQKEMIISALHSHLSDETYRDNFNLYLECYKLFWYCAENLPYPEFYQAWHNPPTTPHPEVEDNTPVASTPFTQQNNLALLPQILNQAIQTHPLNCQPICIDGSRFSDPSNPALQIYTTLKKAGCPASPDGKPRTIAELQAYCEDDLSDHQIALILYEEPTDPPPQGFDMAVLNQLARFSHPPIAVVVPQPLPDCRLPQFLESDPDLMATLLQWLQNLDR